MKQNITFKDAYTEMLAQIESGIDYADACFNASVLLTDNGWNIDQAYQALTETYDNQQTN